MGAPESVDEYHKDEIALKEQLAKGEIDFSRRDQLQNVTLNDLVEMKKEREQKERKSKTQAQDEAMLGDDLEIDIDEL